MNASNPIHGPESRKPPLHTVRVRMGTQSWTLSGEGAAAPQAEEPVLRIERRRAPITLTAMRARIEETRSTGMPAAGWDRVKRSVRDWILPQGEARFRAGLKTGLASGMMLGTVALAGFHQFAAPPDHVPTVQTEVRGTSAFVEARSATPIAYPGLSVEVAVPRGSSKASPWLALTPVGIQHWLQAEHLRPSDYQLQAVEVRAGDSMVPGVFSQRLIRQDEDALGLAESGLLAAISWAADGGRQVDAERALQNALAIPASVWRAWPGGEGGVGADLHQKLQGLLADVRVGNARDSEALAVQALNDWLRLCGWPGVIELSKMSH
ncbi:hypothetical protein IW967_12885 [Alicyclobacillus mali]|uniref:Uncharacterized protein n=1 Tax=Alicyclobacillus mali (ex Roth et al. 2021) TaxID=1123961 RepID=A0ABS0F678_9BACL|nr:hypothetical protein [Alicyclobacillus mali (ex Roth et al. 2021)]MBF8378751.1 hypothetical protein [Alicyclobacillus mali (ex Roth et al. 2021)]MCL6488208.1 hypothetical protein [Alicyclobacillus mali (ex Roth et al. 2021)]